MSKNKRSGADRPRLQRWVKFVGSTAEQWKRTLSQINIEKVPLEYVNDIRFHAKNGKIHLYELKNPDEDHVESLIERVCEEIGEISAVEFVIDLDELHSDISDHVRILLKGSKDD